MNSPTNFVCLSLLCRRCYVQCFPGILCAALSFALAALGREVGTVLGDISQRTVGVEPDLSGSSQGGAPPSLRFSDAVFRLCPRLNYRYFMGSFSFIYDAVVCAIEQGTCSLWFFTLPLFPPA